MPDRTELLLGGFAPRPIDEVVTNALFYSGSTIVIEERATLEFTITDESLIDTDFNWYVPRRKIGSYQIADWSGEWRHGEDWQGFITLPYFQIAKQTLYTVVADPVVRNTEDSIFRVEACNFSLEPRIRVIEGVATLTYQPNPTEPLFIGYVNAAPVDLGDTLFYPQIGRMGIFTYPGVELLAFDYSAQPIGFLFNDNNSFPQPVCNADDPDCDAEFAAFVLANNGGFPIDDGPNPVIFSSNENCVFSSFPPGSPAQCVADTFTCSDGGTRVYYRPPQG
jgi:hypothetical protein